MKPEIQEVIDHIKTEKDIVQKARFIYYLRKNQDIKLKEIADAVGMQPSHIAHIIRLLRLPAIILDGYYSKIVSPTHLFIIARLKSQEDMMEAYETVLGKTLSVQQTEELIRQKLYDVTSSPEKLSQKELEEFIEILKELDPDVKVSITQTRIRSKMVFEMKGDTVYTTEVLRKLIKQFKGKLPLVNKKEMIHALD